MAIRIAEAKSSGLSDDGKEVIIGGSGKYIGGDIELKFARECLDNLIDALMQAKSALYRLTQLWCRSQRSRCSDVPARCRYQSG
jgi:hypothetical protein